MGNRWHPIFSSKGAPPPPTPGRRSALHPGPFSLHAQRKGTKRKAPRTACARRFDGWPSRVPSGPVSVGFAAKARPARLKGLSPAQRATPLPSKRRAHDALWGVEILTSKNGRKRHYCLKTQKKSPGRETANPGRRCTDPPMSMAAPRRGGHRTVRVVN